MSAGVLNLKCEQGATFSRTVTISTGTPATPMNLTGYTARASVRKEATGPELVAMTCTILTPANGSIVISLTAAQTAAIVTTGKRWSEASIYCYDLEIQSAGGTVLRVLNGEFQVSPEVTK